MVMVIHRFQWYFFAIGKSATLLRCSCYSIRHWVQHNISAQVSSSRSSQRQRLRSSSFGIQWVIGFRTTFWHRRLLLGPHTASVHAPAGCRTQRHFWLYVCFCYRPTQTLMMLGTHTGCASTVAAFYGSALQLDDMSGCSSYNCIFRGGVRATQAHRLSA